MCEKVLDGGQYLVHLLHCGQRRQMSGDRVGLGSGGGDVFADLVGEQGNRDKARVILVDTETGDELASWP
ncbi:hypothetical protein GCM10022206_53410 [Streptomyces chiangmaiensis]